MESMREDLPALTQTVPSFINTLVENIDDGVLIGDTEGRIIFTNKAATRINDDARLPLQPEERASHFLLKVGKDEFPVKADEVPLLRVLREGRLENFELNLLSSCGRKKTLNCSGDILFDTKNNKVGAILFMHDNTSLNRAKDRADELTKERIELLRINAELERFSSVAAHDLKSPLNSITQFAEILKEDYGGKLGPDGLEILDIMIKAGGRLRNLIDDLLSYARSGKNLGTLTLFSGSELLEETLLTLAAEIQRTAANIRIDKLPDIYGDRVCISQVFQNLIGNALKYRSERDLEIRIQAEEKSNYIQFMVSDNGMGISIPDQKFAFDLFKRFEGSEKKEGTGLGLPICKRIVESHGGSMWLTSEKNKGTTIYFTIPKVIKPHKVF